jgi:pyrroline-5-carboxylate reductase
MGPWLCRGGASGPAAYTASMDSRRIGFIGGGNMASALIGGLLRSGGDAARLVVVEPSDAQREKLAHELGVAALPAADARLAHCDTVVWAVKPQFFAEAAAACTGHVAGALQISVMAGVRCARIAQASGSGRIVRAMPNTPALIGQGIAGLYAEAGVSDAEREAVAALFAPTGQVLWVDEEAHLDAVTALSGSGPAYVFYFLEAMMQAAAEMGLSPEQGRVLGQATFAGSAALAMRSALSPTALREQVTSKGGTTHAAISALQADGVQAAFVRALHEARARAQVLGQNS